ncbi:radical SAM protein [Desulfatiglans anilini]|uniref:radical SAM protein n=1 Tax=Desulfatiglans anilini TaxID=90728 RepID=UPI00041AAB50|nr:radical SAM protein [Desulfatiglans anilini]
MDYSGIYQLLSRFSGALCRSLPGNFAPAPLQIYVELTYRCNLACSFCQFREVSAQSPGAKLELTSKEFERVLSNLTRGAIVSFSGGEPTLKPGFLDLLTAVSKRNRTHIFTNGTGIDRVTARRFVDLGAPTPIHNGLVLVGISFEGLEKTHNSIVQRSWAFDRTLSGIQTLLEERRRRGKRFPLVEIKAVLTRENLGEIEKLFQLAKDLGADLFNPMAMNMMPHLGRIGGFSPSPWDPPPPVEPLPRAELQTTLESIFRQAGPIQVRTTPQGIGPKDFADYYNGAFRLQDYTCSFPWHGMTLTAHGDIYICPYLKVGNIQEDNWKEARNHQSARAFRKALGSRGVFPGCLGCCSLVRR